MTISVTLNVPSGKTCWYPSGSGCKYRFHKICLIFADAELMLTERKCAECLAAAEKGGDDFERSIFVSREAR